MQTSFHITERMRVATPESNALCEATRFVSPKPNLTKLASNSIEFGFRSSRLSSVRVTFAMVCAIAAILSGCAANQKPRARAFPWAAATNARPLAPEKTSADVSNEDLFADLGLAVPAPPSPVAGTPSGPPRPHVAVVSAGNVGASHAPEAPMIAPQLSPEQTAQAQQQTSSSVSIAEKNVAASQGRSLNAMQSDLASKVRSFLAEAREAAQVGDWTRASNAAKKAEVLSQELAGSF
jgi:hypothetical protein